MNCRRGDIVLVLFPDSNLRTSKRRPALVVQADQLDSGLPQTIVAMITSNMARAGHPSRVAVRVAGEGATGSGLLMDSVVMTGQKCLAAPFDYSDNLDRVIGTLPDKVLELRRSLACDPGTVAGARGSIPKKLLPGLTINSLRHLLIQLHPQPRLIRHRDLAATGISGPSPPLISSSKNGTLAVCHSNARKFGIASAKMHRPPWCRSDR